MTSKLVLYSVETLVCISALYGIYKTVLYRGTFFRFNRFTILFSIIISLLLPLFEFSIEPSTNYDASTYTNIITELNSFEESISSGVDNSFNIDKVSDSSTDNKIVSANNINKSSINTHENERSASYYLLMFLAIIYSSGVLIMSAKLFRSLIKVILMIRNSKKQRIRGIKTVLIKNEIQAFSFMDYLFITENLCRLEHFNQIYEHEKIHIKQKHSYDILFVELLLVFFWFNPFIWLFRRELSEIHEYLADEGAIKSGMDVNSYQYNLIHTLFRKNEYQFVQNFSQLMIKKRIRKINENCSASIMKLKYLIIVPATALLFALISVQCNSSDKFSSFDPVIIKSNMLQKDSAHVFHTRTGKSLTIINSYKNEGKIGSVQRKYSCYLSNIQFIPVGFEKDLKLSRNSIDSVTTLAMTDLNRDNYNEWFIITNTGGIEAQSNIIGFLSGHDKKLINILIPGIKAKDLLNSGPLKGYFGKDSFEISDTIITRTYPVFEFDSIQLDYLTKNSESYISIDKKGIFSNLKETQSLRKIFYTLEWKDSIPCMKIHEELSQSL